jgi:hypothetical protein
MQMKRDVVAEAGHPGSSNDRYQHGWSWNGHQD